MPIAQLSLSVIVSLLAAPALAQVNPLAGETKAPSTAVATDAAGGLILPPASWGKLEPDPALAATGGVNFYDELGWYRFTMADGGTTSIDGTMRKFEFTAGTLPTTCFAVRVPDTSFAKFPVSQIQAEIETLYAPFDVLVTTAGFNIEHRETLVLDAPGQRAAAPFKLLAWDSRHPNGTRATWVMMPSPVGQLTFACAGDSPGHHREVIQRYLRIGSAMTGAK